MKVTGPMIERGLTAYRDTGLVDPAAIVECVLRAALNDPLRVDETPGQTHLEVVDGETVIVGG